jgi:hypothetical protein
MTINMVPPSARDRLGRVIEAATLALLGGFLARTFIALLLTLGNESPAAALAVGWGFFLWPGAIDSLLLMFHAKPIFTPSLLLWTAFGVGFFAGMMDGFWRIHRWRRAGVLGFLLDLTWGLAGSTNGCLLHLLNVGWAQRHDLKRAGAHHNQKVFLINSGNEITLG